MSRTSNPKLGKKEKADVSLVEMPAIELDFSDSGMSAEKRKEDARKPLYIKRV